MLFYKENFMNKKRIKENFMNKKEARKFKEFSITSYILRLRLM